MPGFFRTAEIALLQGRTFAWQDDGHAPPIAIVSENFAESVFPHGDAIGQTMDFASEPKWQTVRIVGIASNASLYDIRKKAQPTVYLPTLQYGDYADDDELLVRTNNSFAAVVPSVRGVIDALGRHTVMSVKPLTEVVDRSILRERLTAMLSAFFGALALLLAAIGLYGLMAHNVTRRRREIGIRMALGAGRTGILGMVLRETLTLAGIGILVGIPCALAATRLIAHMLFAVTTYDPVTLSVVIFTLLAICALAGYIPARRAMRVDPMVALRYE
jgi:predicted permease